MKNDKIIEHVEHYITKDKCKGAIMLTGEWGVGKSYFVQNELKIKLEEKNIKSIVVSLYGLKEIEEISKRIYFELKTQKFLEGKSRITKNIECIDKVESTIKKYISRFNKAQLTKAEVAVAGKTIISGLTSFFGINLSIKDKDLEKIYTSIDLKDTLIILEDIERSEMPIKKILGYVNCLVDQDGVKVLLITNEKEYLHYKEGVIEETNAFTGIKTNKKGNFPTPETKEYLRIKEKTINDTMVFEGNYNVSIKSIILNYNKLHEKRFDSEDSCRKILDIMNACRCFNLRAFIYSCQKTEDILWKLPEFYQDKCDFLQSIFYGNLYYILKIKSGKEMKWGNEKYFSKELGYGEYPLFKLCYDYINKQIIDYASINDTYKMFIELREYDSNKSNYDNDLNILSCYYREQDKDVYDAVDRITKRLENPNDLSFYVYGKISVYLIYVEHRLGCDIEKAKELLINNLIGRGRNLLPDQIFRVIPGNDATKEMREEYNNLKKKMCEALKMGEVFIPGFEYLPKQVKDFCNYIDEHEGRFHLNESFAKELDMYKFSEMFSKCSNEQKDDVRHSFCSMYRYPDVSRFYKDDLDNIRLLKELIEEGLKNCKDRTVEKLQYEWFNEGLAEIIRNLQGQIITV